MAPAPLPPGPKGHLLVGKFLDYAKDPLTFMARCSRDYGEVVRLRMAGLPLYLLGHTARRERRTRRSLPDFVVSPTTCPRPPSPRVSVRRTSSAGLAASKSFTSTQRRASSSPSLRPQWTATTIREGRRFESC